MRTRERVVQAKRKLRGRQPVPNAKKTACPQGHPYDGRNTLWYQGGRYCRTCRNERTKERNRSRPGPTHRALLYRLLDKRDGGRCRYCGAKAKEIDHVIARCNNGTLDSLYNMVMACRSCNSIKAREKGFTLNKKNVLRWYGQRVAPDALFGEPLMEQVKEQRLNRQRRQGLTHIVQYKEEVQL